MSDMRGAVDPETGRDLPRSAVTEPLDPEGVNNVRVYGVRPRVPTFCTIVLLLSL